MKRLSLALLLGALALWSARPVAQGQAPPAKPTAPAKPAATAAGAGRLVEITATDAGGKYLFKPDVINAKPGEALHVRLKAVAGTMGAMPKMAMSHNFIVLKSGSDAVAFTTAAVGAGFAANYTPNDKKDQIVASTPLAGVGETQDVTFKAPAAGTYPFVCTFPGHFAGGMKGSLIVK